MNMKTYLNLDIEDAFMGETLEVGDIVVVLLYFLCVLAVGLWSMWKSNRTTVGGYFLAGRSMLWWPIGASLFSSNVGSGHFVGLAGSGAASGIAVGAYEWNAMFIVLLLAWVFLPVYIASAVVTMPEYLKKRFGGRRIQVSIAVLYLFIYIFTKISVDLYAGALFIHEALKWELYPSVIALLCITGFYTIGGGLTAVIYTDTLQTIIILIGAMVLMVIGFIDVGGYFSLTAKYMESVPTYRFYKNLGTDLIANPFRIANHLECGLPRNDSFHVFRDVHSDFPWTGVVMGMPILSIWYWCSDQVIVQRTLAAKNITHAKAGAILCSYMKILPMFMMVMVGMISRSKFPELVGCVVPEVCTKVCGNPVSCSDIAYPKLVMDLLPVGLRGVMMAVMLSALMSSLTSIFNSSSTIFTIDLWQRARPNAKEKELMLVGRIFVLVLIVVSVLWIPIIQSQEGGQLFTYIQKVSSYFQPPVAVCFILAVFWKRVNESGAFWGMFVGIIVGVIRMSIDFAFPPPNCGQVDKRPLVTRNVHYLHFAIISAIVSALVTICVSLLEKELSPSEYDGLTFWTRHNQISRSPPRKKPLKTESSKLVEHDELNSFHESLNGGGTEINTADFTDIDLGQPDAFQQYSLPQESVLYDGSSVSMRNTHEHEPTATIENITHNNHTQANFKDLPIWKKMINFMCGFESSFSKKQVEMQVIVNLEEDPFWKKVVQYNMYICVIVAIVLWVVFR